MYTIRTVSAKFNFRYGFATGARVWIISAAGSDTASSIIVLTSIEHVRLRCHTGLILGLDVGGESGEGGFHSVTYGRRVHVSYQILSSSS